MRKTFSYLFVTATLMSVLVACNPEDRSDERPLPPVVSNKSFQVKADSCLLIGEVTGSHNSSLKGCGFIYGNDTLRTEIKSEVATTIFTVHTRSLNAGTYYAVAFAQNGVGKSFAPDSIYFTIEE